MPPAVVTVTSTVPVAPGGEVAVIWPGLLTVNEAAGVPPKFTAVTAKKLVPVIVTMVPPVTGPVFGLTLVTVGGANCA